MSGITRENQAGVSGLVGAVVHFSKITSTGTDAWTKPDNVSVVWIECVGGGGSGGTDGGSGGGGGGAGQAGAPSSNNPNWPNKQGGTGGEGSPVPDYFLGGPTVSPGYGTPGPSPGRYFAGGAGGGTNLNPPTLIGGEGGNGGGGDGGNTTNTPGSAGTTNTGGGGGGGGNGPPPAPDPGAPGAAGGSGFVCVRYRNN